jgi:hypothetical protein
MAREETQIERRSLQEVQVHVDIVTRRRGLALGKGSALFGLYIQASLFSFPHSQIQILLAVYVLSLFLIKIGHFLPEQCANASMLQSVL